MKLLKPITFQESQLTSTTATEAIATWLIGTTYALGAKVQYGSRLYESLVGSNLGNQPDTNPVKWLDYSPDNKHAMFDSQVNTQTTKTSPLTVVVEPEAAINSLGYLNITGTQLVVTVKDAPAGTTVYTNTIDLDGTIILDWYMYFFEPYDFKTEVILTNIPSYPTAEITTVLSGGSTVAIGSMVYGTLYDLGGTQYGASVGIRDYSIKTTDDFGNTTFVQRAFSRRLEAQVFIDNQRLNSIYKLLSDVRAVPSVWIGSDDSTLSPLVVFGYYKDFNVTIQYPTYSMCSLTIEGLI